MAEGPNRKIETGGIKGMNFKGESFPVVLDDLMTKIKENCESVFDDFKSFSVQEMYEEDHSGKVFFKKQFQNDHGYLFDQDASEIKGLYLFSETPRNPFYVGISRTIKRRMKQHFFGTDHNQATLAFLMALEEYKKERDTEYPGLRTDFPFDEYRKCIQKSLQDSTKITIVPIADSFELSLSELYYSCYYRAYWNAFETH